ncbi:biopolymer transporter ExbD [uncultured Methanobrevibacter sp.]|uniref:ExbD/TolR family protein n=1 Tax=Methanobrevibacter sp. TaxID=66852 RepID=UPI0025F41B7E|nr:biopolymer transporter ExbD [uncultured Methanobrevibacter sp.]
MAIDVKKHKKKFLDQQPRINLVPFIDILFTIMIFLVVTSNFSATDVQTDAADDVKDSGGKPNVTDVSGDQEYYVMPVANLHKVTVNGQDRSDAISGSAVGVQANVIDQGQVTIKPGEIVIETPPGVPPEVAVQRPEVN